MKSLASMIEGHLSTCTRTSNRTAQSPSVQRSVSLINGELEMAYYGSQREVKLVSRYWWVSKLVAILPCSTNRISKMPICNWWRYLPFCLLVLVHTLTGQQVSIADPNGSSMLMPVNDSPALFPTLFPPAENSYPSHRLHKLPVNIW
jgi:hypothetical protein